MAQRVPWDMSEAVIMLNALIVAREGRMSRKDAIVAVSSELRSRAKRNGIEVDDIFRNVNGITLQMSTMEYILTDGEKGQFSRVAFSAAGKQLLVDVLDACEDLGDTPTLAA